MVGIENLILKRNTKGQQMNLPIYRAKKIGSDEYIIGHYTEKVKEYPGKHYIHFNNGYTETYERIDPTTLAIHFEGMLDSEDNKIFASLSEDGKGGDLLEHANILTNAKMILVASYHQAKGEFGAYSGTHYIRSMKFHLTKIVGAQK